MNASPHDHIGIIIYSRTHSFPYILEHTLWGYQLTPFDERVIDSDSEEILIRKWEISHDDTILDDIDRYVEQLVSQQPSIHPILAYTNHIIHLVRTRLSRAHHTQSQHRKSVAKYTQYECDRRVLQERAQAIQR